VGRWGIAFSAEAYYDEQMKTLVVKIPEALDAELTRVARRRKVTKSVVVRERLAEAHVEAPKKPSKYEQLKALVFDHPDAPTDLGSNQAHLQGYGKNRDY
jgi:hypothetical protein